MLLKNISLLAISFISAATVQLLAECPTSDATGAGFSECSIDSQAGTMVLTNPQYNSAEMNSNVATAKQWLQELGLSSDEGTYEVGYECYNPSQFYPDCSSLGSDETYGYNSGTWERHACSYNDWLWDSCYNRPVSITVSLENKSGETDVDLSDGLVAHYEFEGNANDSSGNGNSGTEYGGITYVDGLVGQAANFEQSTSAYDKDDYILLNQPNDFTISSSFSHSLWVKFDSLSYSNNEALYSCGNDDEGIFYAIWISQEGNVSVVYEDETTTFMTDYSGTLNDGDYHLVTSIKDEGKLILYVDSTKIDSVDLEALNSTAQPTVCYLSAHDFGSYDSSRFNGSIDDFRLYNRALLATEIQSIYSTKESSTSSCDDRYEEGYADGKQYCIDNPAACGITTASSTDGVISQTQIDEAASGWNLMGTGGNVSDFGLFSNAASVWAYKDGSWKNYKPQEESLTPPSFSLDAYDGFWLKK